VAVTQLDTGPPIEDEAALPVALALLSCLCDEVDKSLGGAVCQCTLLPGLESPMDYCDCTGSACGMAWVRVDQVFPSTRFPVADVAAGCDAPLAVRCVLGVHRCVPGMDSQGLPPDAAQQTKAVQVQMSDMAAMRRAMDCCSRQVFRGQAMLLGSYTPSGPVGNCAGGSWPVTVQVWT
jgi:hypothetical protein